jgi:hypothetical protein
MMLGELVPVGQEAATMAAAAAGPPAVGRAGAGD